MSEFYIIYENVLGKPQIKVLQKFLVLSGQPLPIPPFSGRTTKKKKNAANLSYVGYFYIFSHAHAVSANHVLKGMFVKCT